MATAVREVHFAKGLWNTAGGYEFNLTLVVAVAALIEAGPGRPSVDESLGLKLKGSGWALAALAAGVAGSAGAIELAKRAAADQPSEPTGRFKRPEESVEQAAPVQNPA